MAEPQTAGGYISDDGRGEGLGVVLGGIVRDPQSATLTTTIEGLWVRQQLTTGRVLVRIADTSKAFTDAVDTYVVVNAAGALAYTEVASGAAKPNDATLTAAHGAGYELIAKVVTTGGRITDGGVSDLRRMAGVDMLVDTFTASLATSELGAVYYWTAPTRSRIWKFQGTVSLALANTDVGTVTAALGTNDKYTNMTNGVATFALSSAIGTRASALPSASMIVMPGQTVRFTTAKATPGGRLTVCMSWSKW